MPMSVTSPAEAAPRVLAEIGSDCGLTMAGAGRLFPGTRTGRPVSPASVWRWATRGVGGPGGRRVLLEACRVGGRWLTSPAAVARFVAALSADAAAPAPAPAVAAPAARRRAADRAAAELERMGA